MKKMKLVFGLLTVALFNAKDLISDAHAEPVHFNSYLQGKSKVTEAYVENGKVHVATGEDKYRVNRTLEIVYDGNTNKILGMYWGPGLARGDKSYIIKMDLDGKSFVIPFKTYRSAKGYFESSDATLISYIKNVATNVKNIKIVLQKPGVSEKILSTSFPVAWGLRTSSASNGTGQAQGATNPASATNSAVGSTKAKLKKTIGGLLGGN